MRNILRKLQNYKILNGQHSNNRINNKLRYFYFILFCISLILLYPFYLKFANDKSLILREKPLKIPPNPKVKFIFVILWNIKGKDWRFKHDASHLSGWWNIS